MDRRAREADKARLLDMAIRQVDGGSPGYRLESPFGETVQLLPARQPFAPR